MTGRPAGTLLGGRIRHDQPDSGHRTGLEPVLLAASIPARAGQAVLEGGTGTGAALLCLAARLPGIAGLGLEQDAATAEIARRNIAANGFATLSIETCDIAHWRTTRRFDHALANPPWHDADGTASPDPRRDAARRADPALFVTWTRVLAGCLKPRGTLTLVLGAGHLASGLAALAAAGCGSPALFPFWPKPGRPARLVLLRGIRGGRGPARLLPGLTLHEPSGHFTAEADAILRHGAALPFP